MVNRPPVPEWIAEADGRPGQGASFQREFVAPPSLLKAVLSGAAEGQVEVQLNGVRIGEFSSAAKATGFDVTGRVKPGQTNLLVVRVVNPAAAPAIAVLLELNADVARQSWLISDATWLAGLKPARSLGRADARAGANPFSADKAIDAYNSWKLASGAGQATDPATFTVLPGFKAELVRSALPEEGSWIAMAFDPQGRLTLAREKKGLLRLSLDSAGVSKVEVINDTLLECRGLLYAHGALYANANNSKTLVRLRDTKGTGQFDEITELLKTEGGVGHGRNHLKLGPDGWLWIAHGNNVQLPKNLSTNSPLKNFAHDRLIPCPWDAGMFDGDVNLPAGHILRMKPDGSEVQLWVGGLRNPLDVAFNEHGDAFTFDADMEWDVGCPWYMPNRVLHIVPGADYGWRRGTGRWPAWYPDTLPSVVDIGLASPTGVIFGHGSKFPAKYQKALFLCDWAYGRILAVHLTPQGASYTGTSELFVGGRPMNVTDACIGPDGAMWFTTGGRGTQSGLYRISFQGDLRSSALAILTKPEEARFIEEAVTLRKEGEIFSSFPGGYLTGHDFDTHGFKKSLIFPDKWVQHAARVVMEKMNATSLSNYWSIAPDGKTPLRPMLAFLRSANLSGRSGETVDRIVRLISRSDFAAFGEEERLISLRVLALTLIRLGPPDEAQRQASLKWLEPLYPNASPRVNQMLVELLVYLRSPQVIAKTMPLLRAATASEDLLLYPFYLRYAREGWTLDARRAVFDALDRAERLSGGRTYFTSIANVRKEILASLTPEERTALGRNAGSLPAAVKANLPAVPPPRFVKDWKLADLEPRLAEVGKGRSYEGARTALITAQCILCHRVSNDPAFPNSVIGPELLAVGARFNRRDLLFHILEPSAVIDEKFRQTRLLMKDGDDVSGMVEREADGKLFVRPSPLEDKLVEVPLANVRERRLSEVSPMPTGLLNSLRLEQILDLLAYLESGGDPKHRDFQP
ncbi:MAG: hypothetical protein EBS05_11710 [Proteobacteria bacterium]|nr:hypothetical protein [Pseudomonadota bacterium]